MSITPPGTDCVRLCPGRSSAAREGRHHFVLEACSQFRLGAVGGPGTSMSRAARVEGSQGAAHQPLPCTALDAPKCFSPSLQHI